MVQIVLIRPGVTDYDQQGRIQGTLDIPLCERGREEAVRMIDSLRPLGISILITAHSRPAIETGQILAEGLRVKSKQLDKLTNLNFGLWQGMEVSEVKHRQCKVYRQWQEHPESICPPGGETLSQAEARVQAVLERLAKKHKNEIVGLVVPEPLASIVRNQLLGSSLCDLWKGAPACGSWEVLEPSPQSLAGVG